jgi:hypothetical protein
VSGTRPLQLNGEGLAQQIRYAHRWLAPTYKAAAPVLLQRGSGSRSAGQRRAEQGAHEGAAAMLWSSARVQVCYSLGNHIPVVAEH